MEHHLVVNVKLIMCIFEELSSLKIIFCKSRVFCFRKVKYEEQHYKKIFGCKIGSLSSIYLWELIRYRKLCNSE
jgi:hypothetical protein